MAACPAGRRRLSLLAAAVRRLFAPVIREAVACAAAAAESAPPQPQPASCCPLGGADEGGADEAGTWAW